MDINQYETANSWFSAMREKGYKVPVTLCQAIEKIMKNEKVTFPEAYKIIDDKKLIEIKDKEILFDTSYQYHLHYPNY